MSEEHVEDTGGEAFEAEARSQGWLPQEEWDGPEDAWVDAEKFVRRGREILPIVRKNLEREKAERQKERLAFEARLQELQTTVSELVDHNQKMEKRVYEKALKDLQAQRKSMVAEGNFEAAAEIDETIIELKEAAPTVKTKETTTAKPADPPAQQHPAVTAWMARNTWYSPKNPDMVAFTDATAARMANDYKNQGRQPDPEAILAEVEKKVRKLFPDAFDGAPAMFSGAGKGQGGGVGPTSGSGGKGFASLPSDAKDSFERFFKSGLYGKMDKKTAQEQYFNDYQ